MTSGLKSCIDFIMTSEFQLLLVLGALIGAGVFVRRRWWTPGGANRQRLEAKIGPYVRPLTVGFYAITMIVWLIIWLGAPDGGNDGLSKALKKFYPDRKPPALDTSSGPTQPPAQ